MNKRIEQLLEQARAECFRFGSKPATTVGYDELEKFAELIVGECVERIKRVGILEDIENETDMVVDAVKEHFGIE